jgi:surface antigen
MVFLNYARRSLRPLGQLLAASTLLALGACGSTLPIFSEFMPDRGPLYTSAIRSDATALSPALTASDWNEAASALATALGPDNAGTSVLWSSKGGTKGSFRALGIAFMRDGDLCRAFEAEVKTTGKEPQTTSGTACRSMVGAWHIVDTASQKS